jgi:hypothetical protein
MHPSVLNQNQSSTKPRVSIHGSTRSADASPPVKTAAMVADSATAHNHSQPVPAAARSRFRTRTHPPSLSIFVLPPVHEFVALLLLLTSQLFFSFFEYCHPICRPLAFVGSLRPPPLVWWAEMQKPAPFLLAFCDPGLPPPYDAHCPLVW